MGSAWLTTDGAARICDGALLISESPCEPVCGGSVSCCGTYMWPDPGNPCGVIGTEGMNIRCAPPASTIVANLPSTSPSGSCGIITKPYYVFAVRSTGHAFGRYLTNPSVTVTVELDGQWRDMLYACPLPGSVPVSTLAPYDPMQTCGTYTRTGPSPVSVALYPRMSTFHTNQSGFVATWDWSLAFRNNSLGQPPTVPFGYAFSINNTYGTGCSEAAFFCTIDWSWGNLLKRTVTSVPAGAWSLTNTPCPGLHHFTSNATQWDQWVDLDIDITVEIDPVFGDNCAALGYSASPFSARVSDDVRAALQSTDPRIAEAAAAQIRAMGISCCGQ